MFITKRKRVVLRGYSVAVTQLAVHVSSRRGVFLLFKGETGSLAQPITARLTQVWFVADL